MSYRPITDLWLLARPKVKYYGAYPSGFLERARALLGVTIHDPVLHVCAGRVKYYPFWGLGPNDRTLDLDPLTRPDFLRDARGPLPTGPARGKWAAILADPPYTPTDAKQYAPGAHKLPSLSGLVRNGLDAVRPGGRVGLLAYRSVPCPERTKLVALVGVIMGQQNRIRLFSVFEKR